MDDEIKPALAGFNASDKLAQEIDEAVSSEGELWKQIHKIMQEWEKR